MAKGNDKSRKSASKRDTRRSSDSEAEDDNAPAVEADSQDEGEESEYEIEKVLKAEKGHFKPGQQAYFVKWKGYPNSENSWVAEEDFNAHDLLKEFWDRNKNQGKKTRPSTNGRKSDVPSKVTKSRASRSGPATSSDDEASSARNAKKRGRPSSSKKQRSEELGGDDDDESRGAFDGMDVDVTEVEKPPKKKSKTSSMKPKGGKAAGSPEGSAEPDAEEGNMPVTAFPEWSKKASWEKVVAKIETVERTPDEENPGEMKLLIYFLSNDGRRGVEDSRVLRKKCPQAIIDFYEHHLRWQANQAEAEAAAAEAD